MAKTLKAPFGVLLILIGLVWFLQGLDVIGGSGMSGKTIWAIIGPIVAIAGAALIASGIRDRRR